MKHRSWVAAAVLILALTANAPAASAPPLLVGAATVDITPDRSQVMAGYGVYFGSMRTCRWSQGAHDPLLASAVLIDQGGDRLLLATFDLVGVAAFDLGPMRDAIAAALPIDRERIILSSSHTHHGPDTVGLWGTLAPPRSGRDEAYMRALQQKAVGVAVRAFDARRPATLAFAVGEEKELHENIRRADDPDAPIDDALTLLVARDAQGGVIATITNWACHATTEGEENLRWSADWVANYRQALAAKLPGIHVFLNGAIGGAVQPSEKWRNATLGGYEQGRHFKWAEAFGQALAAKSAVLIAGAKPLTFPRIELQRASVKVRVENYVYAIARGLRILHMDLPALGETYRTEITAARLGPLRIGTMPGEVMPDIGLGIRRRLGGEAQLLVGLAQDWLGYIVERKFYDDPRYAYERLLCVGPELGPNLAAAYRGLRFE